MKLRILFIVVLPIIAQSVTIEDIYKLDDLSTHAGYARFLRNRISEEAPLITPDCVVHLLRLVLGILNGQLWAIKIFDAGAKLPSGLLRGHGAALGTFDECINAKSDMSFLFGVTSGKYCQGSFLLVNLTNVDFNLPRNAMQTRLISFKESTITLPWGACFPDACTAKDLETLHLGIFRFNEENCQTEKSQTKKFDNGDKTAIGILAAIFILVALSTVYDITCYYFKKDKGHDVLKSFSLVTTGRYILTVNNAPSRIASLHGIRVFTMFIIMGGMRYFMFVLAPLHNWLDILKWVLDPDHAVILEMLICMDTFLVLSGFLISYKYLEGAGNGKSFNIITYCLNRIIRLTPSLAILVLLHATLLRHIGSGPLWPKLRDHWLVNNCREYWWSTLLYVQNYVNPKLAEICILPTWQLSVDMQLFIVSPLILYPLKRWPKVTLSIVALLIPATMVSLFLSGWFHEIKAVIVMQKSLKDVDNYFQYFFFPTHTRAAPWLIGFILGGIVHHTSSKKQNLLKNTIVLKALVFMLWVLSIGLLLFIILVARIYLEYDYDQTSHSVLLGLIRPLWGLGISWVIFACATNYGGPINRLLSSPACVVLSRISYSIYLLYFSMMFLFTYQTRLGIEFNHLDAIYRIFADITICILAGFVWTLFFELPFITLTKNLLKKLNL